MMRSFSGFFGCRSAMGLLQLSSIQSKILFPVIVFLLAGPGNRTVSAASGGKKSYPSYWQSDGIPAEWPLNTFYISKEGSLLYAIGNDSLRVYVCLRLLSEQQQQAVMREGIALWFDPSGKKKPVCSVRIPCAPMRGIPPGNGMNSTKDGTGGNYPRGSGKPINSGDQRFSGEMNLSGFSGSMNGIFPIAAGSQTAEAAIALDSTGVMTLELSIPISAFPTPKKSSEVLTFGYELKSTDRQQDDTGYGPPPGGGSGRGSGMPGGGSGMPGGGGGGGRPGGGMDDGMGRPQGVSGSPSEKTIKGFHRFSVARFSPNR
ncbi:MAG: hypothetical protein JXA23_08820 [Bacteroidales bacterium]|nr:hypothetical protein [Bacteroidales bacterium]